MCVRTILSRVTVRSGRLRARTTSTDQHDKRQPSCLSKMQSVSPPPMSPPSSTPTASFSRSHRPPTTQPLCQRQEGHVRRRLRTGLSACVHRGALGTATDGCVRHARFPSRELRSRITHSSHILTQGIFKWCERGLPWHPWPAPHWGCTPLDLGRLSSDFKTICMDLYGCTDLRGRSAERGRGSHASANQVIAEDRKK